MNIYLLLLITFSYISCSPKESPERVVSEAKDSLNSSAVLELPTEVKDSLISFLTGNFDPSQHVDFTKVPEEYASRKDMYIQKEALEAFAAMRTAARKEGIELTIISATRNFEQQKAIWDRKFEERVFRMSKIPVGTDSLNFAKDILKYSSMPGTSRHHWGTDIDLNSLEPAYFETPTGKNIYTWLSENAPNFGYCQPYTNKESGRTGYEEEKWHWSYTPLSKKYIATYNSILTYENICCFKGSELASILEVIPNYVNGIGDDCQTN